MHSPLSSINFLHYTLAELETGIQGGTRAPRSRSSNSEISPAYTLDFWRLKEVGSSCPAIATDNTPLDHTIILKSDRVYILEIALETEGSSFNLDKGNIKLSIEGASSAPILPLSAQTDMKTFLLVEFSLDRDHIQSLVSQRSADLQFLGENGPSLINFSYPKLESIDSNDILENLRAGVEEEVLNIIKPGGRAACVVIEGAGGVGKTYLCSNLTKHLSQSYSFTPKTLHLSNREPWSFLIQLALTLFDFDDPVILAKDDGSSHGFLAAYLKRFLPTEERTFDSDEEGNVSDALKALPLDVLVSLCAQSLDTLDAPHVVWFQSCHDASAETLYALARLCGEISQRGWQNLRFIFEYRSEGPLTMPWKGFKGDLASDALAGSHFVGLVALSTNDIRKALASLFAPTLVHEVAESLSQKTGGNPLYMDHVLRHFLSRGYMHLTPNIEGAARFRVLDIGGIRDELDDIAESTTQFLQRRLSFLMERFDGEGSSVRKGVASWLLWLQSISSQPPTTEQLQKTLNVSNDEFYSVIRCFVAERIFSDQSLHGNVSFIHQLVELAARKVQLGSQDRLKLTENLTFVADRHNPRDCLNVGAAMASVHRLQEAELWLQSGFECVAGSDYYYQRLILKKLDGVLELRDQQVLQDKIKWLDVKIELGWAELQAGSLINARQAYRSAEELCRWPFDRADTQACRLEKGYSLKILHKLVTVDIELLEIHSSLSSIQDIFGAVSDINLLFHTSNRLLLALMYTNHPDIGANIAPLCLSLGEACTDSDALSVVMSDLGALYFAEYPKIARKLWGIGLAASVDKRQRTHSQINGLVADMVVTGHFSETKHKEVVTDIVKLKLNGQLSRMELLRGAGAFLTGDLDLAEDAFSSALKKAIAHNQTLFRWLATHNLSVCRVAQSNAAGVSQDLASLEHELTPVNADQADIRSQGIVAQKMLERVCRRLSVSPSYRYEDIDLPTCINVTGPLIALSQKVSELQVHIGANKIGAAHFEKIKKENSHIISSGEFSCLLC